jgi:hypothetical protein
MAETLVSRTGAGRGIGVHRKVPRVYLAIARAMAGVASMPAAISAADKSLRVVIRNSPLNMKSQWRLAPQGCGFSFQRALQFGELQGR